MSRGLGRTQRGILEVLSDGQWHWVDEVADMIYAEQWDDFCKADSSIADMIDRLYSYDVAVLRAVRGFGEQIDYEVKRGIFPEQYRPGGGGRSREGGNKRIRMRRLLSVVRHGKTLRNHEVALMGECKV